VDTAGYRGLGTSLINAQRSYLPPSRDAGQGLALNAGGGPVGGQQHSKGGTRQLYWYFEPPLVGPKSQRHEAQMVHYILTTRAAQLSRSMRGLLNSPPCVFALPVRQWHMRK